MLAVYRSGVYRRNEGKTRENLALFSLFLQWMTLNFDASHFVLLQLGLIAN